VCATSASTAITTSTGRQVELARSHRADSREIDVRVDGSEYGAQRYEHYENDCPDEHRAQVADTNMQKQTRFFIVYFLLTIA